MKRFFLFLILVLGINLSAAQLPDNIYFRAMQDEMQRSKKQLRIKDNAKPLYIAYTIKVSSGQSFAASMGALEPSSDEPEKSSIDPRVIVYMYSGDFETNSSGYELSKDAATVADAYTKNSYEAIRNVLWRLSDVEYVSTSKLAEEKAAVKKKMQVDEEEPEFSKAPHAHFVEPIPPFVHRDRSVYQSLVQKISAEGKKYPYLETYNVSIAFAQGDKYFLDSEGNFLQKTSPQSSISLLASFRNQDGYEVRQEKSYDLPIDGSKIEAFAQEKSAQFLHEIKLCYKAKKAEFYSGPVLLKPAEAESFLYILLAKNLLKTKHTLTPSGYKDTNQLVHKKNHRIMSPVLEVFDRPLERTFNGFALSGFTPIDDEGVAPKSLHIVEKGKLKELPTVRSLIKGQKQSNGHALLPWFGYPRASYTNLFFEATDPLPQDKLEQKLLQLCKEQELEYCYIIHGSYGVNGLAEKIYVSDGHKEPVYGFNMQISGKEMRPLRDIVAAGDDATSFGRIIVPSILVNEVELLPIDGKPDRKPFVEKP